MRTFPIPFNIARTYLLERLQDGNALAHILLQHIAFDRGHYYALLNPSADKDKIFNFRSGGILPQNPIEPVPFAGKSYPGRKKEHSFLQLVEYLKSTTKPNQCCYFEDLLHRREDSTAAQFKSYTLYYKEEPYLFLQHQDFSLELAEKMIRFTNAQWHYMNIISEEPPSPNSNMPHEKLQQIALGTTTVILGAYDMEGFVVWESSTIRSQDR